MTTFILLFYHCDKREWLNPYGGELDSAAWAVDSFVVEQGKINEAILGKIKRNYLEWMKNLLLKE